MSQPVPEELNEAEDLKPGDTPPGEHDSDLPGETTEDDAAAVVTDHNAETSQGQPSQ